MISIRKTVIVNIIAVILLLLMVELAFKAFENHSKSPKIHIDHKSFRMSRPEPYLNSNYFSKEFIEESFLQPNGYSTPEGTRIVIPNNYNGKWFSIDSNKRVTLNQPKIFKKKILLFGGSTIYNSEVPDNLTIASLLQDKLITHGYRNVLVENYGVTSVHAAQQLERLQRDVKLNANDIVIFYDGVNDVIQRVYYANPDGWIVGQTSESPLIVKLTRKFKKYSAFFRWIDDQIITKKDYTKNTLVAQEAANAYATTISNANLYVQKNDAKFIHFLQPTIYTRNNLTSYEKNILTNMVGTDMNPVGLREMFEVTYPLMKDKTSSFEFTFDLTNLLNSLTISPYLDFCHVTESANALIANQIFKIIQEASYLSE
jgi:hypothetical protein